MGVFALCTSLLLLLSFLPALCASDDKLLRGGSLVMNQTLVSNGRTFALGFFTPGASTSRHYLGIWYNGITNGSVVWVANRENPFSDSSVMLQISNDSNLVVSNSAGDILWSSNTSTVPSDGGSAAAVLQNNGNLLLTGASEDDVRWQSFDHPTDTILPGMRLWVKKKGHVANRMISWKGTDDPSPGVFSYGIDPVTTLQTMIWKGEAPYRRTCVWDGTLTRGGPMTDSGYISSFTIQRNEETANITFTPSDFSVLQRIVIDHAGVIRLFYWNSSSRNWSSVLWYGDAKPCDTYGTCGPYGVCQNAGSSPACSCIEGYEPRVKSEWNRRNYSSGCDRQRAPSCDGERRFTRMTNVEVPDKMLYLRSVMNDSDCEAACRSNCSCAAYSYASVEYETKNISRCLVWYGELIDLVQRSANGGDEFYLLVPASDTVVSRRKSKIWVLWVASLLVLFLVVVMCIFLYLKNKAKMRGWWKNYGKRKGDASMEGWGFNVDSQGIFSGSKDLLEDEESQGKESDLPMFSFDTVAVATNNFSDTNRLGQGGFGDVYRVTSQ